MQATYCSKLLLVVVPGVFFGHWSIEFLLLFLKIIGVLSESVKASLKTCLFLCTWTHRSPQGAILLSGSCQHTTVGIFVNPSPSSQNLKVKFLWAAARLFVVTFDSGFAWRDSNWLGGKDTEKWLEVFLVKVMPAGTKCKGMWGIWIFLRWSDSLLLIKQLFFSLVFMTYNRGQICTSTILQTLYLSPPVSLCHSVFFTHQHKSIWSIFTCEAASGFYTGRHHFEVCQ